MKIHFVYSVPRRQGDFASRFIGRYYRISGRLPLLPVPYRRGWLPMKPKPLRAPFSITVNLFSYLNERAKTLLYDWEERRIKGMNDGDIILGHPHPNPESIVRKAFDSDISFRARVLIFPMHYGMESINQFALPLLEKADIVLGIMGEYWYKGLRDSMFSRWQDKIVPLDMAIDVYQYPHIKRTFNQPGSRGYLYIGNNRPEKGCGVLSQTMAGMGDLPKGWIGEGPDIPHMKRIAGWADLTPEFMSEIAGTYDIFVNTSVSDANPTTILEAMAWGFPVACTPQSGYVNVPSITSLSTTDIPGNVEALHRMQYADEESLEATVIENRNLVETRYTWDRFCTTVWRAVKGFVEGDAIG